MTSSDSRVGYGQKSSNVSSTTIHVDLLSDTVTKPTDDMKRAMADAAVGDDVFEEDPTVKELERVAADMFDKESALFVPTGTMGNLCSIMSHCQLRGSELIVGNLQHIFLYEQGGAATLAGVHSNTIPNAPDGTIPIPDILNAIRDDDVHNPVSRMICLENTHNSCGGRPLPLDYVNQVANIAKDHNLKLHVDGARIFNAAAALNTTVAELNRHADSVSVCLSKGLGTPAGSVVVGRSDFIRRCRRARKALGGGMRQAGVLAACGLIGLETMSKRLHVDHTNAKRLAEGLANIPDISINPRDIHTNIVFFDTPKGQAGALSQVMESKFGVRIGPYSDTKLRAVVHHQVSHKDVDLAIRAVESACGEVYG